LKFEELFYNQLRLIKQNLIRKEQFPGQVFSSAALLTNTPICSTTDGSSRSGSCTMTFFSAFGLDGF
jgi:hypothetical protein